MQKKNIKLNTKNKLITIPSERVFSKIFLIRGKKVMMDKDLAELYGVETKSLNRAVKRNLERFPEDFMFQLNKQEAEVWKSQIDIPNLKSQIATSSSRYQIGTLKSRRGQHIKYLPYVFTEQGVAMLSSVLHSKRAIQVNIQIMRTFTKIREMLSTHKELREKIEKLERKYDQKFRVVFEAIGMLLKEDEKPKNKMGFKR
jgi:hypothetical protein